MREIKFRAWNKETGKMILLDPLQWPLKVLDEEKNWKVMMFTGLLDRHGKEIYEGDIVESVSPIIILSTNKETGKMGRSVYVVGYEKDRARFNFKRITDNNFEGYGMKQTHQSEWYTIIGNLYENPELVNPCPAAKE